MTRVLQTLQAVSREYEKRNLEKITVLFPRFSESGIGTLVSKKTINEPQQYRREKGFLRESLTVDKSRRRERGRGKGS
jgi:hypothetical protein